MVLAVAIAALVLSLVIGLLALVLSGRADDPPRPGGGPEGGPGARARRRRRRRFGLVTAVTAFVGLGVPALVIAVNHVEGPKQAVGGVELTGHQQHGRELFARTCRNCHTLQAANTVGPVGPSLDVRLGPIADRAARVALVEDAIAKGRARGNGQMPVGLLRGADARDVADFLAAVAGRG